ncbi:hypothetical protein C7B69_10615 [filamentous cyanobacterium Phorm 46]|nr:hypothetical protein C7B69_10615 [filamentous cyanobacterium Phorm 46]
MRTLVRKKERTLVRTTNCFYLADGADRSRLPDDSEGDFNRIRGENIFFDQNYTALIIGTFPDKPDAARILEIVPLGFLIESNSNC